MHKKIIVNFDHKQTRVAVLEDGRTVEFYIERPAHKRVVGNIYKGVVDKVLPGIQAAFVDIGQERNAFLYLDDILVNREEGKRARLGKPIESLLKAGQEIIVQVTKESFGSKGVRLTTKISLPGRFLVLVPKTDYVGISRRIEDKKKREKFKKTIKKMKPEGTGFIVRTAAENADQQQIESEMKFLLKQWHKIEGSYLNTTAPSTLYQDLTLMYRIARDFFNEEVDDFVIDDSDGRKSVLEILDYFSPALKDRVSLYSDLQPIFERYGIEREIRRALERFVWLRCGGHIVIDETEALTVVDVNTGRFTGKSSFADTILKTNMQAADEIVHQLRLRDIGGIIIIDFIDMDSEEHQRLVLGRLMNKLKRDRTKTHILGLTGLGLVEMTRKNVRQSLSAVLMQECSCCAGKGRLPITPVAVAYVERSLKKTLNRVKEDAALVELHPAVAAVFMESNSARLKKIETEISKRLFIREVQKANMEDYDIIRAGTTEEISLFAQSVN